MRRLPLPLIATSAVLAATAIAVPALAASGSASPTAHSARARRCSTVIVISHGRHVRACLIPGPRGFTGFPGLKGATGKTGKNGTNGKNGANGAPGAPGAPGTARAYAIVEPTSAISANLVQIATANITGITELKEGVFCLVPASFINAAAEPAAVSPEISYSPAKAPGMIALNMQRTNGCPAGQFEVDTYNPAGMLSSNYAFSIVIP